MLQYKNWLFHVEDLYETTSIKIPTWKEVGLLNVQSLAEELLTTDGYWWYECLSSLGMFSGRGYTHSNRLSYSYAHTVSTKWTQ